MQEKDLGELVGQAVLTGDLGRAFTVIGDTVDRLTQQVVIDAATSGSITADLDALAGFYNELSKLNAQLGTKRDALQGQADRISAHPAAGHVGGVQRAWRAIAESAGAGSSANSMAANLQSVQGSIQHYMQVIMQTVHAYAEQDGWVVSALGRASEAAAPPPPASAGTRTGASSSAW